MFEQSLLIDHASGRKTTTFAVSLAAQILITGVLLLTPLLYRQVLPAWRMPEIAPRLVPWQPPRVLVAEPHAIGRSSGLSSHMFHPPAVLQSNYGAPAMVIGDYNAPELPASPGIALPIGISTVLPRLEVPSSPVSDLTSPLDAPITVGGAVQSAKLIKQVVPTYPQSARQLRISGVVHLLGSIAQDGTIRRLQVLSGHPLLMQAALDAVSQWIYRPTILNGHPVEVEAPIDVIFTLSR